MVNVFLEGYGIDAPWLYDALKKYVKPNLRVTVAAFSFRDKQVRTATDWAALYGKESRTYAGVVKAFARYGVPEKNITFIDYFSDTKESATQKIVGTDIVYFPGGLPDRMMERIEKFGLSDVLKGYGGIVMGYSAGALIQLGEYHLSPDADYPEFIYRKGLSYVNGFYLEVHYTGSEAQDRAIERVVRERGKPVYAIELMSGALIVDGGKIVTVGKVKKYGE